MYVYVYVCDCVWLFMDLHASLFVRKYVCMRRGSFLPCQSADMQTSGDALVLHAHLDGLIARSLFINLLRPVPEGCSRLFRQCDWHLPERRIQQGPQFLANAK